MPDKSDLEIIVHCSIKGKTSPNVVGLEVAGQPLTMSARDGEHEPVGDTAQDG